MRRLIYDPNALHISSVRENIKNTKSRILLQRIIGKELTTVVEHYSAPDKIPMVPYYENIKRHLADCCTSIYIHGATNSGKTSVVGSLLALPEVVIDKKKNDLYGMQRAEMLAEVYKSSGEEYKTLHIETVAGRTEITFATISLRKGLLRRRSKVAFIECNLNLPLPTNFLSSATEQIHIFCIDCTADIEAQANAIAQKLTELENDDYIKKQTTGVYVLVTKVDTMYRVPLDYRTRAAQTMVTIRCRSLWQKIRNICYDKGIFGAAPIAYSIGDVKLKAVARITNEYSQRLLYSTLIPKCRLVPTLLERLMKLGGKRLTYTLSTLFLIGMCYGLYSFFHIDKLPPKQPNLPYEFMPDFRGRVHELQGKKSFSSASELYKSLKSDLDTERSIKVFAGDETALLLPTDSAKLCAASLESTMSDIVAAQVERQLRSSSWNSGILNSCLDYTEKFKSSKHIDKGMRKRMKTYTHNIRTYNDILKFTRNVYCSNISEVKSSISRAQSYRQPPYTNDNGVRSLLDGVAEKAITSCAKSYKDTARSLQIEYSDLERNYRGWSSIYNSNYKRRKSKLKDDARSLRSKLNDLRTLADKYDVSSAMSIISEASRMLP